MTIGYDLTFEIAQRQQIVTVNKLLKIIIKDSVQYLHCALHIKFA